MITREKIRRMAGYSFSRGEDIYRRGKITKFEVERCGNNDRISADVRGSEGNVYDVSLMVNFESGSLEDSWCDCPAFYSYEGICKHCTAVLLKYISEPHMTADRQKSLSDYLGDMERQRRRQTTWQIKELLRKQSVRQALPVFQGTACGSVHLEPELVCTSMGCTVEFRIGINRMYVLKDIFGFMTAMRAQETVSYGKSLQFLHVPESFDEESKPLAAFIVRMAQRLERQYQQESAYVWSMRGGLPKIRALPLDAKGLDDFLDAVGQKSFLCRREDKEGMMQVASGPLKLAVEVNGNREGAELSLENVPGYETEKGCVYFREDGIYRITNEELEGGRDFLECMRRIPGRKAFIQKEDLPAFFRQLMPVLKERFECRVSGIDESALGIVQPKFRFYLDTPQEDMISCRAVAEYGEREYSIYAPEKDAEMRDLLTESGAAGAVGIYCNAYDESQDSMVAAEDELIYRILTEGVERLQQIGEVYISDALRKLRIIPAPSVSVGISLGGDLLKLSITSEDMPKEKLAEILSRYDRKRKFYRLRDGSFVQMEGAALNPLLEAKKALGLTEKQLLEDKIEVPRYRMLYLDEEFSENGGMQVIRDEGFRRAVECLQDSLDREYEIPEGLNGVLREYQKQGYRWMRGLHANGFGGILADDMGLGKTLQVITFLLAENRGCSLIVCPASLVYNWKKELERFAPQLRAEVAAGTAMQRREFFEGELPDVLITSYDLLRRDMAYYEKLHFFCQVIDEAQYIKNHGTQSAKAVKKIRAEFKLALTGTPIENRLSELWSIFDYLMPGYLYGYQRFREELEQPIVSGEDEDAAKRLQKLIHPFVLRRLKKDVLKDLPDKLEENIYAGMEGEQQELYDAHVKRLELMLEEKTDEEFDTGKLQILAELTRLRQLCCDPGLLYEKYEGGSAKKELAMNLIRSAVESGHKVLLFSQFTTMLDRLADMLEAEGIAYHMLTGATPKEKRAQMVEAFDRDDVPVFCISLKAGGTGLNLTAADVVIHFDPWWNVAVQNQATDRAHRIGQKNVVTVCRLIAKGTIEEKILELQERKTELADKILGGEGFGGQKLSREEILKLLR